MGICWLIGKYEQQGARNKKWIGSTKTRIHINAGPGNNEFAGVASVSTRDLQENEIGTSEVRLEGKRIQVEP
jgi:hypothetical protein